MIASWLGTAVTCDEVYYNIRPNCTNQHGNVESTGECLTLSQFINNSTDYIANDTTLIFLPGNHTFKTHLTVENIKSFSMSVWPASSSKVVIKCNHNARFEFRNVSTLIMNGVEFVGCFNNSVVSVGQLQLENICFIGNRQQIPVGQSTVLSIDSCAANLDRITIAFTTHQRESENYTNAKTIGILLRQSVIKIIQSQFEGNGIDLGAVIYDEVGSNITIINTTFINNSVSDSSDCNARGSIMHTNGHNTTMKIFNCRFIQNVGLLLFGVQSNMLITRTEFISNNYSGSLAMVYVNDSDLTISDCTFTKK